VILHHDKLLELFNWFLVEASELPLRATIHAFACTTPNPHENLYRYECSATESNFTICQRCRSGFDLYFEDPPTLPEEEEMEYVLSWHFQHDDKAAREQFTELKIHLAKARSFLSIPLISDDLLI